MWGGLKSERRKKKSGKGQSRFAYGLGAELRDSIGKGRSPLTWREKNSEKKKRVGRKRWTGGVVS